jgi:DNA-binding transcriptional regulator YhcF (GntR family)
LRNKNATRNSFSFVYADPKQQTISQNFDISNDKLPELKVISTELLKNLKKKGLNRDEILAIFAEACSETINVKG